MHCSHTVHSISVLFDLSHLQQNHSGCPSIGRAWDYLIIQHWSKSQWIWGPSSETSMQESTNRFPKLRVSLAIDFCVVCFYWWFMYLFFGVLAVLVASILESKRDFASLSCVREGSIDNNLILSSCSFALDGTMFNCFLVLRFWTNKMTEWLLLHKYRGHSFGVDQLYDVQPGRVRFFPLGQEFE